MAATAVEAEIRSAFDELLAAFNTGDREAARAGLADRGDAVHIGSDPDEWLTTAQVVDTIGQGGDDIAGVTIIADDVTAHAEGDSVGWVVGRGRFRSAGGAERPVRMSAVLTRDDGRWVAVHLHASVGVPNAELFA